MSITYNCGCVNDFDRGVMKSILKCDHHKAMQREIGELGEAYYRENGAMDNEACRRYADEFEDCFGKIEPVNRDYPSALEVGAGASHYVPMITDADWLYVACEPSRWARQWMMNRYCDRFIQLNNATWESFNGDDCDFRKFGMILSAHSLEHMIDAPAALEKMAEYLSPSGVLYLIIPCDDDPLNPDHYWFFNTATLDLSLGNAGLIVESMVTRKRIERERFIYCKARKPN